MLPTRHVTAALAVSALALAACAAPEPWQGTKLDNWAWWACDDLAHQISQAGGAQVAYALPAGKRADFAAAVAPDAGRSTVPAIADAAVVLTRSTASPGAWRLGLDTIAARCLDNGWHT